MFRGIFRAGSRAFTGGRQSVNADSDSETEAPLNQNFEEMVQMLPGARSTVNSTLVKKAEQGELQALACPPLEFTVKLPKDYASGEPIRAKGPHGIISFNKQDAKPGETYSFKIAAPPDVRITVPKDYKKGSSLVFDRADGVRISVAVPCGLGPGQTFDVTPPVLMVKVPEGAKAGDPVVFRDEQTFGQYGQWLRATVPNNVHSVGYFAARLPPDSTSLSFCANAQENHHKCVE